MKPFISVIVPIYNVEKYLEKCIRSLIDQTYNNYEIILVNDGSPDNCGEICERLKLESDKITVLHIPNGGVCNARNLGMKLAKGDYFCFVDSDDWVEKYYIEDFANNIEDDYTLIVQDANRDNDDQSEKKFFGYVDSKYHLDTEFVKMVSENDLNLPGGYPWNKLYSKKIITENNLQFDPEIKLGDDEKWNFAYLEFIKKIKFSSRANYHYIYNPNSISNQKRPFERELLRFEFIAKFFVFALHQYDNKNDLEKYAIKKVEHFFRINIFDRLYKHELSKKERLQKLETIYRQPIVYLNFLRSDIRFRDLDYQLLRSGNFALMDSFKKLRLRINS